MLFGEKVGAFLGDGDQEAAGLDGAHLEGIEDVPGAELAQQGVGNFVGPDVRHGPVLEIAVGDGAVFEQGDDRVAGVADDAVVELVDGVGGSFEDLQESARRIAQRTGDAEFLVVAAGDGHDFPQRVGAAISGQSAGVGQSHDVHGGS